MVFRDGDGTITKSKSMIPISQDSGYLEEETGKGG